MIKPLNIDATSNILNANRMDLMKNTSTLNSNTRTKLVDNIMYGNNNNLHHRCCELITNKSRELLFKGIE